MSVQVYNYFQTKTRTGDDLLCKFCCRESGEEKIPRGSDPTAPREGEALELTEKISCSECISDFIKVSLK